VGRISKVTKLTALSFVGFLLASGAVGLAYRAYQQHQIAKTLRINTPNGIDEREFVKIGDINQWITIRGRDRDNPILLILHGGPGATTSPLAPNFLGWENDFTIVQWDQRGAGKTFGKSGPLDSAITINRMAQDGLELSNFVRRHLNKDKIILLGWSWGPTLGIEMVKERPDLFYAYVGTGQIVNVRKNYAFGYSRLLAEGRARADQTGVSELEAIGPPPFSSIRKLGVYTRQARAHEAGAPSTLDTMSAILLAPGYSTAPIRPCIRRAQEPKIQKTVSPLHSINGSRALNSVGSVHTKLVGFLDRFFMSLRGLRYTVCMCMCMFTKRPDSSGGKNVDTRTCPAYAVAAKHCTDNRAEDSFGGC
jgi:pimeloyl-ACP methyl ester carboxylesterase